MRKMTLILLMLFLAIPVRITMAQDDDMGEPLGGADVGGEAAGVGDGEVGGEEVGGAAVGVGDGEVGGEDVGGEAIGVGDGEVGGADVGGEAVGEDDEPLY